MVKELYEKAMKRWESFDVNPLMPALRGCNEGAIEDVLNVNGCRYYQVSSCLADVLKPKQTVELGGAMGVWALCVLHMLPIESKLYSITLAEHGLEFSFIKDTYPNLIKIVGDDLSMDNWKDVDLHQTDLWFFDSLHTREHLTKELELYSPFFKEGTVLLFDDIRMDELWPVWEGLSYEKLEITNPCHYSGFGIAVV
jgi:hypothetical protein